MVKLLDVMLLLVISNVPMRAMPAVVKLPPVMLPVAVTPLTFDIPKP